MTSATYFDQRNSSMEALAGHGFLNSTRWALAGTIRRRAPPWLVFPSVVFEKHMLQKGFAAMLLRPPPVMPTHLQSIIMQLENPQKSESLKFQRRMAVSLFPALL